MTPAKARIASQIPYPGRARTTILLAALQSLGDLGAEYSRFLRWRADLLPADEIRAFRETRHEVPPVSRRNLTLLLREELGARGDELLGRMDMKAVWSNLSRCGFRCEYQGRLIAVQVARDPISAAEFREFVERLRRNRELAGSVIGSNSILRQFMEWLSLSDDPLRERSYIEAVQEIGDQTSFVCPEIIPEICSRRVLTWSWIDGEPVSSRLVFTNERVAGQLAELVLEQCCALGIVDGDLDPDSILIAADGRLAVQHWNRMISLPPSLIPSALKYLSGVMSGNYPTAARMLLRLALGRCPEKLQAALLRELSSTAPEPKGRLHFPASAMMFENNWRALSKVVARTPLYLHGLHRNLNALGYWCAETEAARATGDQIAEAQFAVLGRLLRTRKAKLLTRQAASEWGLGSTILFVETLRQMGRTAEDLRENELSMRIDIEELSPGQESRNRFIRSLLSVGLLLVVFIVCLRWGPLMPVKWSVLPPIIAAAACLSLIWVAARLE
jgi:hypothetical protein